MFIFHNYETQLLIIIYFSFVIMGKLLLPLLLVGATFAAEPCLIVEEAQDGWKSLTSPDYPKQFNPNTQCIYR